MLGHRTTTPVSERRRAALSLLCLPGRALATTSGVITAKPYASTPSKSTTTRFSDRLLGQSRHVEDSRDSWSVYE